MIMVRRFARWLALLLLASIVAALGLLYFATVELSPGGVHQRLRLPVPGLGDIAIPNYAGTADATHFRNYLEGPIVRLEDQGSWSAKWLCNGQHGEASGTGTVLEIGCDGRTYRHFLTELPVPEADLEMPRRVAVISDLEGEANFFESAVRKIGVVDAKGDWAFGEGTLVVLGDSVDRGRDVMRLLWRIRNLAIEAQLTGGSVHFILGNHEQYILRNNISRANAEHLYGLRRLGGVEKAFAIDTVLGKWLRSQPTALRLGDTLFVHGGVSIDTVRAGVTLSDVNEASRIYFAGTAGSAANRPALDAAFGLSGVTQYRGMVTSLDGVYAHATDEEVDAALDHFGVERVVVAHSIVPRIESRFGGKVWAIDVADPASASEILLFNRGEPSVVDIGIHRISENSEQVEGRNFAFFAASDWAMLREMFGAFLNLSRLPHPY